MSRRMMVVLSLLIGSWALAQPTMLTREEAGQIALRFARAGNYPGTIGWLTVNDLPEKMEVDEENTALIRKLAAEGRDWSATTMNYAATWFGASGAFGTTYVYLITISRWPDRLQEARVNAFTGYCELHPLRRREETNDQLGYGHLPVKPFSELQQIALNIAKQMLGPGTFEVFTEPYDLANPAHYEAISKGGSVFVIFKKDPQTGAHLPQVVELYLNSRTGAMEAGVFYKRPVQVDTTPIISKGEAKTLAASYLADAGHKVTGWLPEGFHWFKGIIHGTAMGRDAVVGLYVMEDDLLEQHLMWTFIYTYTDYRGETTCGLVWVNAHTGEVVPGFSSAIHLGRAPKKAKEARKAKEKMVEIPFVHINGKLTYLYAPMLLVKGRLYIPSIYADNLGIKYKDGKLKDTMRLRESERLVRNGREYLLLSKVCQISGIRLVWDNRAKMPLLFWNRHSTGHISKRKGK